MDHRTEKVGGGRRKTEKVAVWTVTVAAVALVAAARSPTSSGLLRPPPSSSDIHSEYVKFLSGHDTITAYLAYPERRDPAPAVIVIHEIFGMSDFIRQTTEQLAKDGFVAIAPDLLSRRGGAAAAPPSGGKLFSALQPHPPTLGPDAVAP